MILDKLVLTKQQGIGKYTSSLFNRDNCCCYDGSLTLSLVSASPLLSHFLLTTSFFQVARGVYNHCLYYFKFLDNIILQPAVETCSETSQPLESPKSLCCKANVLSVTRQLNKGSRLQNSLCAYYVKTKLPFPSALRATSPPFPKPKTPRPVKG